MNTPTRSRVDLVRKVLSAFAVLATIGFVDVAAAGCLDTPTLTGVNLAGAEFAGDKLPGVLNTDYVYPSPTDLLYFAALGSNAIRLPFLWERVQPNLNGPLDDKEVASIVATVAAAKQLKLCVILDVHNYGKYRSQPIGSPTVPVAAFIDLWTRLAAQFNDESATAFDLMNEPNALSITSWADAAKRTLAQLRKNGAKNLLLVAGGRWSGAHEWDQPFDGSSNAIALADLRDPAGRTLIEVHQYADADYSGTKPTCIGAERFKDMFAPLTQWARTNKQQLFLGEFGVPPNKACLDALAAMLKQVQDKAVWRGWTYWVAGAWWGDYPISIEPHNGIEAPQVAVLREFLGGDHAGKTMP